MKFMMMMHHPGKQPYALMSWARADLTAHIEFMKTFNAKLAKNGELVSAEGLAHPEAAKLVRSGPDQQPITDGVFPESKEFLVGFWIIDVENEARACALAAEASAAPGPGGKPLSIPIELRQVMGPPV